MENFRENFVVILFLKMVQVKETWDKIIRKVWGQKVF